MKSIFFYLSAVFFIFSSCTTTEKKEIGNKIDSTSDNREVLLPDSIEKNVLANTIGVVVASIGDNVNKSIELFDSTGILWKQTAFEGGGKKELMLLNPFSLNPDNFILVYRCLAKEGQFYKVVVNENKELIKYISIKDNSYIFQTWEQHILSLFSVDFDVNSNPLHQKSSEQSEQIPFNKDEYYHPNKIEGEWLQVKWGDDGHYNYGWIKWKQGNKLLIELFYFA